MTRNNKTLHDYDVLLEWEQPKQLNERTWLPISLKNAAKCDKWYQLQNRSNYRIFERKWRLEEALSCRTPSMPSSVSNKTQKQKKADSALLFSLKKGCGGSHKFWTSFLMSTQTQTLFVFCEEQNGEQKTKKTQQLSFFHSIFCLPHKTSPVFFWVHWPERGRTTRRT